MTDPELFAKAMAFQEYVRARKLEEHNKRLKRPEFEAGCRRKHERLAEQYPDFPAAYDVKERNR